MYVGRILAVRDDAAATIHNIAVHELLFRFGIVSDLIASLGCRLTALALYEPLHGVDRPEGSRAGYGFPPTFTPKVG